ncbi:hypothetical protein D3C87_1471310 [compost metagenome]
MDDGIDARHQRVDGLGVRQIARHDFFLRTRRAEVGDIGDAHHIGIALQAVTHDLAEVAGRAGQQDAMATGDNTVERIFGGEGHRFGMRWRGPAKGLAGYVDRLIDLSSYNVTGI